MELNDRPRLKALLDHFALMENDREAWRVAHPLPEAFNVDLSIFLGSVADQDR